MKRIIPLILLLVFFASCNHYYKAVTTKQVKKSNIEELKQMNKYFILRSNAQAYAMKNITTSVDEKTLQCNLEELSDDHKLHLTKGRKGKMIYAMAGADEDEIKVLNEVHLYVAADTISNTSQYFLPLEKVLKMEILQKDKQKTRSSQAAGTGIIIGASILLGGLILYGSWVFLLPLTL